VTGLFGCLDVAKNKKGDFIAKVTDPLPPPMLEFRTALLKKGLWTMLRGHTVFCNPPLIIKPEQIREAFSIIDECLPILDKAMEDYTQK
jgi:adenosylmethionine-8-amino-7-oxononanoate aminotransferase